MSTAPKVGDRVRVVVEGTVTDDNDSLYYIGGYPYVREKEIISLEVIAPAAPPKPAWHQGDVVIIHPDSDFRFSLLRQAEDRWVCSRDKAGTHQHTDSQIDYWFDNGNATAIIAGGEVVTE